jgi:hypothetical protein
MACLTFAADSAHAQIGPCIKFLFEYVGKPVAAAAAEKGVGLAADYFMDKLKDNQRGSAANELTRRDVEELRQLYRQNGETDCQLRQDLQATFQVPAYNPGYAVPTIPRGSVCITLAGSCQVQVPRGYNCFCFNAFGQTFPGIAD